MRNLLLNFNAWFLLALCTGPIIILQFLSRRPSTTKLPVLRSLVIAMPFYLWLAIFTAQPHKEERFMYPAYPFLCCNAAMTLHTAIYYLGHSKPASLVSRIAASTKATTVAGLVLFMVSLGFLRTIGTVTAYHAPLRIYEPLRSPEFKEMGGNLCLGKEWYRFPSSYFLPPNMRARFIKSDFDGLLPGQFWETRGSLGLPAAWRVPSGMNDENIEDPGKYVRLPSGKIVLGHTNGSRLTSMLAPS